MPAAAAWAASEASPRVLLGMLEKIHLVLQIWLKRTTGLQVTNKEASFVSKISRFVSGIQEMNPIDEAEGIVSTRSFFLTLPLPKH